MYIVELGYLMQGQKLDLVILMGTFKLHIFYNSVIVWFLVKDMGKNISGNIVD